VPHQPPTPADHTEWQAWFDGSALPNPGRIGLGAVLRGPGGQQLEYSGIAADGGCNNEAELLALGKALEMARASGARHLVVRGDSDFAVRHLRGEAHTSVAHLHTLIRQMQPLLADFDSVRLEWIPRHRNPDADRLSRAALGLPDKPAVSPGVLKKKRRR
jgi:ribonuclease HI